MTTNDDLNDSLSTSILNGDGLGTPAQKKKMRRSWFETPPPTKLEIALEKKKRRSSGATRRKSDEEVETLILTHFTSAPRIGFGNIKVGKAKSRILMVRNPHEYEQEVIVERFPYKKNFSIDSTKFTVDPDDYKTLSITWAPDEACSCREMVLFKVDGVYRLQAYVFGIAEEIKQKKATKRGKKGLLGIKVKKPFSIINTPGLACIRDNYSPLDAVKPRMSNVKQHPVIGEKYELLDKHSSENTPPPLESTAISVSSVGYTKNGDRVLELGCSPTFSHFSPILKTSEVDGSCIVADSCYSDTQFSALRDADNTGTSVISRRIAELEDRSSILSDKDALIDTPKNRKSQNSRNSSRNKSIENGNKENSPLKRPRTKSAPEIIRNTGKKFLSPETFLNDSMNPDSVKIPVKQHPVFACIHENKTVSPNSFLEDMNHTHGDSSLKGEIPSPSKILQDTIPHNLIVEQLKSVQTSLHEQSFDKLLSYTQKKSIQQISSSKAPVVNLSNPTVGKDAEIRRTTFLKQKQVKKTEKLVKRPVDYQSPRRTTFLVSLKKNRTSVKKEELPKSCKKSENITKEDKPKRRKLLGSNKVGQTPVSKEVKSKKEIEEVNIIDSVAITRTKEVVEEVTVNIETQEVYQIFTGTVTKDKPSPQLQDTKKTHGKRLFDSNSPKKETSPFARTVTKDKPSPQIQGKVIGKKLFDDEECTVTPLRTSPFIDEFGSPSVLPSSPSEVSTRRTTLTVTKQRPSDALLHATMTVLNNNVFECTPTGRESGGDKNETCMVIDMKKSPSLLKVEDPTISLFTQAPVSPVLLGSPSKLPTSPNPDMSRRSTHIVASPKFVDLSSVSPKRLFPPLDDVLEPVLEDKQDSTDENQENIPPVVDQLSIPNESTMSLKSLEDLSKDISDMSIESEVSVRSVKSSERSKCSEKNISPKKVLKSGSNRQSVRERKPSGSGSRSKKESIINNSTGSSSITPNECTITLSPTSSKTKTKPPVPTPVKRTKPVNSSSVNKPPPSRRQSLAPSTSRERLDTVGKSNTDRRRSVNPLASKISTEKKFEPVASLTRSTNNRNTPRENLKSSTNLDKSTTKPSKTSTAPVIKKSLSASVPSSTKKPRGPVKGLTQKLILIKRPKTAVPKHPMPFAARNMYYDERWLEKQERGFSHWLNFILTPPEEYNNNVEKTKVDAGSIFVDGMKGSGNNRLAPTKEVLSIRAYTARRRMNRLRRASCQLYQSESVIHVIRKVEIEVEKRRLAVRKDRMLHADLGIKQSILDMLLCYNPLWLRIGLETIYGEMILLQSNKDVIGLSRFILYRLLSNPDIAAEYAHPTVPHLYRDGYAEASSSHTLKKFLLLVYFLDKAKQSRLIDHDPCLFCKNADIKASKNLLVQFSRDFLSGEGDITKHLGYLGYIVTHIQTPLDEFDYAVSALGVDLRDGLRLTRVMEYLTNNWTLMSSLRSPAISRLQKIHNVDVVFKVLAEHGLDVSRLELKLNARDIVDGHREKTLSLLWHIIFHFQVDVLIDIEQLRAEIVILEKTLRVKVSMQKLLKSSADNQARRDSGDTDVLKNERLTLLLKWCRLVCLHYGIKVENFTVSFSDGRALCYLIHHYYPALLPANLIHNQTTAAYMEEMEKKDEEEFDEDASFDWSPTPQSDLENPEMFEQLLNNERENFKLLYEKVSGLGGIPLMLKASDMSNTIPDEKIVMTYVSHLCGRLLDIRAESRAARVIQIAWRKYWLRHAVQHQQNLNTAARVIQIAYREYRKTKLEEEMICTAIKIQALWRGHKARKRTAILRKLKLNYKMSESALLIQRALQSNVQRKRYLRMKVAAVTVQSVFRGYLVRKQIQRHHKAAKTIQLFYHGYKQTVEYRQRFLSIKSACITIQRTIRYRLKQMKKEKVRSAVIIQKYVRGFLQRNLYRHQLQCIIKIQANYRRHRKQTKYLAMKYAAIFIQRYYRQYKHECVVKAEQEKEDEACVLLQHWWCEQQKLTLQKQDDAVLKMQANVRGFLCRKQLEKQNKAAIKLQSMFKMKIASKKFLRQKAAAIVLSYHFKSYIQRKHTQKKIEIQKNAATKIQSLWRSFSQQRNFNNMKSAAVKIQSLWRSFSQQRNFNNMKSAAVKIQSLWRSFSQQRNFNNMKSAAVKIQSLWRSFSQQRNFNNMKSAAVKIQSLWRSFSQQRNFNNMKSAAVKIQSLWRSFSQQRNFNNMKSAAVKIQSFIRRHRAVKTFRTKQQAVILIQRWYRAVKISRVIQKEYQTYKTSAILIQTAFKTYMAVKTFRKQKLAVLKIQSYARMMKCRNDFVRKKKAVEVIQVRFRAFQLMKTVQSEFQLKRTSCVKLQSYYRGHMTRKQLHEMNTSATKIQATYRSYIAKHRFQQLCLATKTLQACYRNRRITKQCQHHFQNQKSSAILIQKCFRLYLEKRNTYLRNNSAVIIQSAFHGYMARKSYQKIHSTVIFLQRLHKSSQITKTMRSQYLHQKYCTIVIQKVFRGYVVKRSYLRQKEAAITIQTNFRRWKHQHEYRRLKSVVCDIQRIYRNNRLVKCHRLSFVCMKTSAIRLQSSYRGYQQRIIYQRTLKTIIRIQTWWRCISSYRKYCHDKQTIVNLQRRIRRHREMVQEVSKLACKKAAILKIQTVYRGYVTRKSYSLKRNAAVKIQAAWRGFLAYQQFQRTKSSAIACQRTFRNNSLAKRCRNEFLQTQKAAVCIQSVYKAKIARQWYIQQRSTAIAIQSRWRTMLAVQLFKNQRKAVSTIQTFYRSYRENKLALEIQSKKEEHHANQMKKQNMAAVKIQARVRSYLLQKQFRTKQASAICIQSVFRAYQTRKHYQNMYNSVVIIQNRWRAALQARKSRRRYLMTYGAIITIQAMVRGFLTRKKIKDGNLKCILIQSHVRGYLARLHFLKLKAAAIVLQNIYRSNRLSIQTRAEYLQKKLAVLQIQKWYRLCRLNQTRQQLSAAIKIQSWYRSVRQRQTYCENRRNIICVQSCVRRFLSLKHSKKILSAIVTIQRNVRTYLFVKRIRCAVQKRHTSALLIQKTFKKCVRLKTERKHEAAITIQSVVRTYCQRKVYKETLNCVRIIQSRIRTYLIRKQYHNLLLQHRAARIIQSAYKNHIIHLKQKVETEKRKDYLVKFSVNVKYHLSAVVIQRLYRKHLILQRAQQYLPSIIYIQLIAEHIHKTAGNTTSATEVDSSKEDREDEVEETTYSLCVEEATEFVVEDHGSKTATMGTQYNYKPRRRSKFCQTNLLTRLKPVNSQMVTKGTQTDYIQNASQTMKDEYCMVRPEHIDKEMAKPLLQSQKMINSSSADQEPLSSPFKDSDVLDPTFVPSSSDLSENEEDMENDNHTRNLPAAEMTKYIVFEANLLELFDRCRECMTPCTGNISYVNGSLVKISYICPACRFSFKWFSQPFVEGKPAGNLSMSSAILLSGSIPSKVLRMYNFMNISCISMSTYLNHQKYFIFPAIGHSWFNYQQDYCRDVIASGRSVVLGGDGRCDTPGHCAKYGSYNMIDLDEGTVVDIQLVQRKFRAIRERREFLKLRSIVCNLQNNIRHWLNERYYAATVIQRTVKLWLVKHRLEKQHRLISKIQAVWKGYALRKKTHTKKLAEMRRRINKANESACEEDKLGNRTTSALDYLLRYKQMSYVLEAVMHLEVATRLSPRCCERMVEVNAVSVIFTLMRSCNRSLPHMEVIKYSISILLNLAKYEKTIDYVYNVEDSIANLLELMTIFREKGNIFTKTATLMGILALDHHRRQAIVSNRNYTDKIKSMYALTARKHKLEEGRNLAKARIAASRTFNSTLPLSTPAKKRRIRPDWILNRDSLHEIENPMRAIKFVMDNLGLTPK